MPNPIERHFRAIILYTGLFWFITGLWGIPSAWVVRSSLDSMSLWKGNEVYFSVVLLLIYGSRPVAGWLCLNYFRKLAARQYQQIPGLAEMPEPRWHDTAVFTTLLATGTGLYCLDSFFLLLPDLMNPLMMIGQSYGDITGIAILDVWYYYWETMLVSIFMLGLAILFLTQSGKIAARVTQYIDTTPPPKQEDEEDDPPAEEPSGPSESSAEGGTDEQTG